MDTVTIALRIPSEDFTIDDYELAEFLRGKAAADLESSVHCGDTLVAKASGNHSIFRPAKIVP